MKLQCIGVLLCIPRIIVDNSNHGCPYQDSCDNCCRLEKQSGARDPGRGNIRQLQEVWDCAHRDHNKENIVQGVPTKKILSKNDDSSDIGVLFSFYAYSV